MKTRRYAIHTHLKGRPLPRDFMWVSYARLLKFYGLNKRQCIHWSEADGNTMGLISKDFIHLYPRPRGDYWEARRHAIRRFEDAQKRDLLFPPDGYIRIADLVNPFLERNEILDDITFKEEKKMGFVIEGKQEPKFDISLVPAGRNRTADAELIINGALIASFYSNDRKYPEGPPRVYIKTENLKKLGIQVIGHGIDKNQDF